MARLLKLVGSIVGALLYVWFEAVRSLPRVKARKQARRRLRLARRSADPR